MKLESDDDPLTKRCDVCQHRITDTGFLTDGEAMALVAKNPEACLKVDFAQNNLTIIYRDEEPG